jgi:Nitroreductase family
MAAIQLIDLEAGVPVTPHSRVLSQAAVSALAAPSLLNTQPWRWRVGGRSAELWADRSRQVTSIDPEGRLLSVGCGAALHHAVVALAAIGAESEVGYLPDAGQPDLVARITLTGERPPKPADVRLFRAIANRHSDRRPFADRRVPGDVLDRLRAAAEAHHAHAALVRPDDIVYLTAAAGRAASVERADPAYRADLATWVGRPASSGDGVPVDTTVADRARPVPIRDFRAAEPEHSTIFDHPALVDRFAEYAVLFTDGDQPLDWVHAGEALSGVLLTATFEGLATSMMSDLIEVESAREGLRRLLAGVGWPILVLRIGYASRNATPIGTAPRRPTTGTSEH